ncbi:MAG TPA: triose-phosphate isomerase [Candidatus Limnocylindrales bacterium]|nr:triose-phosphate isomerase [Candidatus Limnocylindrales bacterium]
MTKTLIVGNWKMHLNIHEASLLVHRLSERIRIHRDIEVVLAPSLVSLQPIYLQLDHRKFRLAAQNAYFQDEGPFTGEVSFNMLRGLVDYVIVGHSDRRYKFGENLEMVRDKVAGAVRNNITPILCVGETKQERIDGETMQVLHDQVTTALSELTQDEVENIVIAYEPIWALSNGKDFAQHEIPTPDIIAKATGVIRNNIRHLYGKEVSENVRILYGGSTSSSTAHGLLSSPGINGLLVGGASLNYSEFSGITEAAYRLTHQAEDNGNSE